MASWNELLFWGTLESVRILPTFWIFPRRETDKRIYTLCDVYFLWRNIFIIDSISLHWYKRKYQKYDLIETFLFIYTYSMKSIGKKTIYRCSMANGSGISQLPIPWKNKWTVDSKFWIVFFLPLYSVHSAKWNHLISDVSCHQQQ